jgi:hypothetical protein
MAWLPSSGALPGAAGALSELRPASWGIVAEQGARRALGPDASDGAWARGCTTTLPGALAKARASAGSGPASLSTMERPEARRVATGASCQPAARRRRLC